MKAAATKAQPLLIVVQIQNPGRSRISTLKREQLIFWQIINILDISLCFLNISRWSDTAAVISSWALYIKLWISMIWICRNRMVSEPVVQCVWACKRLKRSYITNPWPAIHISETHGNIISWPEHGSRPDNDEQQCEDDRRHVGGDLGGSELPLDELEGRTVVEVVPFLQVQLSLVHLNIQGDEHRQGSLLKNSLDGVIVYNRDIIEYRGFNKVVFYITLFPLRVCSNRAFLIKVASVYN